MPEALSFNSQVPTILHIDLNSCFASVEQQANPLLRGKPIAVAAYDTPRGCILAPSREAKVYGVKTGMRVFESRKKCPGLIVLKPDPWKYRNVHLSLRKLLAEYTSDFYPKSIDEFVLNLTDFPILKNKDMKSVAMEIKDRIKKDIGDFLTVSIGIAPNRFLAKLASNLKKPDGLTEINKDNFLDHFSKIELTDIPYIKERNALRLNMMGIFTTLDFYHAPLWRLKAAFQSINGYYWYTRLRGFEVDDVEFGRRSYGNSYSLPSPFESYSDLAPLLSKLCEKTGFRLRGAGYSAKGVHLAVMYREGAYWHTGYTLPEPIYDSRDIYKAAFSILKRSPYKLPVANLAVSVFGLLQSNKLQLKLFEDEDKKRDLIKSLDKVNDRWGNFVIYGGRMAGTNEYVPDRIAFGGVKELEEFAGVV
jgi:DNA polymerase-4